MISVLTLALEAALAPRPRIGIRRLFDSMCGTKQKRGQARSAPGPSFINLALYRCRRVSLTEQSSGGVTSLSESPIGGVTSGS